jgi:hypothetical protein
VPGGLVIFGLPSFSRATQKKKLTLRPLRLERSGRLILAFLNCNSKQLGNYFFQSFFKGADGKIRIAVRVRS